METNLIISKKLNQYIFLIVLNLIDLYGQNANRIMAPIARQKRPIASERAKPRIAY